MEAPYESDLTPYGLTLSHGDALSSYHKWPSPQVIICDGPYGVSGYDGDLPTPRGLAEWYEPHVAAWSQMATPQTTLWFWNTEIGWATVHPTLERLGWDYKTCNFWDKGMSHVAGNTNVKTLSHLPIVSEVCVQYVRRAELTSNGQRLSMKEWLRSEWGRTGLPFSQSNTACGVVDAATRKYLTRCHLWYMPPPDMFERLSHFANTHGRPEGRPYFSVDGQRPLTRDEWAALKPKFRCPYGLTNVWQTPQLRGVERLKRGLRAVHFNQKPLTIIERLIDMSSDSGDMVWDPFGGLFTTAVACVELHRQCCSAELSADVYAEGLRRVQSTLREQRAKIPFDVGLAGTA